MSDTPRPSLLAELKDDFTAVALNRFERVDGRSFLGRVWLAWRMLWEAEAMPSLVRYRFSAWLRRLPVVYPNPVATSAMLSSGGTSASERRIPPGARGRLRRRRTARLRAPARRTGR